MYLKHLLYNDVIAVADHATRRAIYLHEDQVLALIAAQRIEVVWPRKKRGRIRGLNWVGPPLTSESPQLAAMEGLTGSDIRERAPYSNKNESDKNPSNVWTHANRSTVLESAFLAVRLSCGAQLVIKPVKPKKQRRRS